MIPPTNVFPPAFGYKLVVSPIIISLRGDVLFLPESKGHMLMESIPVNLRLQPYYQMDLYLLY